MKLKITKKGLLLLISGGVVLSFTGCSVSDKKRPISGGAVTKSLCFDEVTCFQFKANEVESLKNQGLLEEAKKVAKDTFITGVDFFFYDGEVCNVTLDSVEDASKNAIMACFTRIDTVISSYDADWKEELGDKYQVASEYLQSIYVSSLDKIKEYLGDDNYQALGEVKDQIIDDIVDTKDKVKEKAKSWYEEFRSE